MFICSKVDDIPKRRTVQWPNNTKTSLDGYQMLNIVDLLSSKTFPSFGVSLLTDGNLGVGGFGEGYYFCSNQEPERYVLADIGDNHQVIAIKIYYRLSHPELVQNLKVSVGKKLQDLELDNSFCAYREGNPKGNTTLEVLYCESAMTGRYIKVAMLNTSIGQFFCFCELQIFGSNKTVINIVIFRYNSVYNYLV
ncbi:hypothetical protein EB796_002411 [Bugula neritina]|uniref:Uncharacterized protein n=1 Tax=Bugula neritina TaxID=10212 RepID=A0A7J7KM91_BUGNE|nr:hypothetical protein EB796_002411 [Bugula neritina]